MSGISAVYILDHKGRVLISRSYRGDLPINIHDIFNKKLLEYDEYTITPIIRDNTNTYTFFYLNHNNLIFLAVTKRNSNCMMIFTFLK